MKFKFIEKEIAYDGTQLAPLNNYLKHSLLGNSVVSWVGACDVSFEHMVDGEDLLAQAKICSDKMVHFIFELFDTDLRSAVAIQRLFAASAKDLIEASSSIAKGKIQRHGDDLFFENGKLSISIATKTVNSSLIHFAINVVNEGTPVKTACLNELQVDAKSFSIELMKTFSEEFLSIVEATQKVRTV